MSNKLRSFKHSAPAEARVTDFASGCGQKARWESGFLVPGSRSPRKWRGFARWCRDAQRIIGNDDVRPSFQSLDNSWNITPSTTAAAPTAIAT
jgi:hypothetical protein